MISPLNEWYIGNVLVCAHFSSNLTHGTYCLCMLYYAVIETFRDSLDFPHVNAQAVLW